MAASRAFAGVLSSIALAIVLGSSPGQAAQAEECWDLNENAERFVWGDEYRRATEILTKSAPQKDKIDEAIRYLKRAIKLQPASARQKKLGGSQGMVDYFPYFWLAQAYRLKGDYGCAAKAIQREEREKRIPGSGAAEERAFNDLKEELKILVGKEELAGIAQAYERLPEELGPQLVNPDKLAADVKRARETLQAATTKLDQAWDELTAKMVSVARDGAEEIRRRIQRRSAALEGAIEGKDADPPDCSIPSDQTTDNARQGLEQSRSCARAELRAIQLGGRWACGQLETARRTADGMLAAERDLLQSLNQTASKVSLEALPAECREGAWDVSYADASRALDQVTQKFQELRKGYGKAANEASSRMAQQRGQLKEQFVRAAAGIPDVPDACESSLGLSVRGRLQELRKQLDPSRIPADSISPEVIAPLGQAKDVLGTVAEGVAGGVQALSAQARGCFGEVPPEVASLEGLATRYRSERTPENLTQVCRAAVELNAKVETCWISQTGTLSMELDGYRWQLEEANAWLGAVSSAETTAATACLHGQRTDVAGVPPVRQTREWVTRARNAIQGAKGCLTAYRPVRDAWSSSVVEDFDRLERATAALDKLPEGEAGSQLTALQDAATRLQHYVERLGMPLQTAGELMPRASDRAAFESLGLREVLERAGLATQAPVTGWKELERLASGKDDGAYVETWKSVRDSATLDLLVEAAQVLRENDRLAQALGPFTVLHGAFTLLGDGRLDQAILTLRSEMSRLPERGSVAALGRATLAYALFIKLSLAGDGSLAAKMLRDDARAQVRAALQADSDFEPPSDLFAGSFQTFFREADVSR